jgi:ribosomal protein S12 methylthiotransferase
MVTVGFVSLGCPKNLVDSEVMMGAVRREGFRLTARPEEADVIVVNTCGFIEPAREESIDTILEMARHKRAGSCKRLVVAGCMVQRYPAELKESLPEVDAFIGLDQLDRIIEAVRPGVERESWRSGPVPATGRGTGHSRGAEARPVGGRATYLYDSATPRLLTGPEWSAYLKISEGCDNPCTFCAIPSFRGGYRSRPLDDIRDEAERLAASGVRELNLIAQDSTAYGRDIGLPDGPARLLRSLNEVTSLRWIRLFYLYPNRVTDTLLEAMADCERVVEYVDFPLQSASRTVLQRMRRGGSRSELAALIKRMRRAVPGLAIRTTFITGFPGETDEEFRETLSFLRETEFNHVGVFTYSHEEGTAAFEMEDDVPAEVKEERRQQLLTAQEGVSLGHNRRLIGSTVEALCEGVCPETDLLLAGRLASQAPGIDGTVLINDGIAAPGEFVRVTITEAHPYDLVGAIDGRPAAGRSA